MGFCRLLYKIYRQLLLFASRVLGADNGDAACKSVQESGDGVVELAHVDGPLLQLGSCVQAESGIYISLLGGEEKGWEPGKGYYQLSLAASPSKDNRARDSGGRSRNGATQQVVRWIPH